ncbi:MAG: mechanosensitive ion channel family protein [candidate division Zixibacteria bacterium]|nr:mechanosensitive ion channel family protein [candidate division Zixibacteria bacterium]
MPTELNPTTAAEALIMAAVILAGTVLVAFLVRIILKAIGHRIARRTKTEIDDIVIDAVSKPLFYLILIGGLELELRYLVRVFPDAASEVFVFLHGVKFALGAIVAGWLVIRLANGSISWYGRHIAIKTETRIDEEFIPIVDRIVKLVVFVLVLMSILSHFQVDIKGLVAVLGVGSLAIALAAQDTLANMIAGFILMLDRPFRVGDRIALPDGRRVDVHEIGLRSTKFMTFDNTLIIIPNAEISKMTINNISYPMPRLRVRVDVGVAYGSDVDKVKALLVEAAAGHPAVLTDPAPNANLINMGESSIDFSLFAHVAEYQEEWAAGNEIRERILKIFEREKVKIPYPHRTIDVVNPEKGKTAL